MIDRVKFETVNWDELRSEKLAQALGRDIIELQENGRKLVFVIQLKQISYEDKDFFKVEARLLGQDPRAKYDNLQNVIQVTVSKTLGVAKFGPKGNILMVPPGIRLGSYLMSRVIKWLQTYYPEVEIAPGALSLLQGQDDKERKRRNRFYESHGFDVVYNDPEHKQGTFAKDHAKNLTGKILPDLKSLEDMIESDQRQRLKIGELRVWLGKASEELVWKKRVIRYLVGLFATLLAVVSVSLWWVF